MKNLANTELSQKVHIALHRQYPKDPLYALYDVFLVLPPCSLLGVVVAAIQEIQSLHQIQPQQAIEVAVLTEREACARACDGVAAGAMNSAAAIRQRKKEN